MRKLQVTTSLAGLGSMLLVQRESKGERAWMWDLKD